MPSLQKAEHITSTFSNDYYSSPPPPLSIYSHVRSPPSINETTFCNYQNKSVDPSKDRTSIATYTIPKFRIWCNIQEGFRGIGLFLIGSDGMQKDFQLFMNQSNLTKIMNKRNYWYEINVWIIYTYKEPNYEFAWDLNIMVNYTKMKFKNVITRGGDCVTVRRIIVHAYGPSEWRVIEPHNRYCNFSFNNDEDENNDGSSISSSSNINGSSSSSISSSNSSSSNISKNNSSSIRRGSFSNSSSSSISNSNNSISSMNKCSSDDNESTINNCNSYNNINRIVNYWFYLFICIYILEPFFIL